MSHPTNDIILDNMREEKELYDLRIVQYKEMKNPEAVELARKLAQKITDRAHRLEGYTQFDHTK